MFKESVKMSWKNIAGNKMRSFLTTLGIMIGVTAIISLVTVMEGAINETNSQFEELGAGKLSISIPGNVLKQGVTLKEMEEISNIDNVKSVTPTISTTMPVVINKKIIEDIAIQGKNEVFFNDNDSIIRGRGLTYLDIKDKNNVCIIDKELEEKVFSGKNSINEKIIINGTSYEVVGVIDLINDDPMSMLMMGQNEGTVMIPYKQVMDIMELSTVTNLEVVVSDTSKTSATEASVEGFLTQKFNGEDDAFTIINMESILDVMETMQDMMKGILIGIASISLLVGGVGISNVMLLTTTIERRTEIGLRKSLGAEPKDIQLQFLIEAVILSLVGGIVGAILGISISFVLFDMLSIAPVISVDAITLGVGFSALIGIIFGWAPAKKASELNPIDALRGL